MSRRSKLKTRTQSGRATRAGQEREYAPALVRRLRDAAMAGLRDPEWGTELGRLYLQRKITDEMYSAGKWWAEQADRYLQAIDAPSPDPRAIDLEVGMGASPADPDSPRGQEQARRDTRATDRFFVAFDRLQRLGPAVARAVRQVCERDEAPAGYQQLLWVRNGLLALADHRGLTRRPKSVHTSGR